MQADPLTSGTALDRPADGQSAMPLFHAACLFAVGIAAAQWLWLRPSFVLIAIASIATLCVLAVFRADRITWLPMATLWLLLGVWCALMEPHPAPAPELSALSDGLLRTVEGTVIDTGPVRTELEQNIDEPSTTSPAQRIDLRVSFVEVVTDDADLQTPVSGGVRLTIRWPEPNAMTTSAPGRSSSPQPFHCGDRVSAVVRLFPPETYHDPGVWSRADYLLDQGITATAAVAIDRIELLGRAPGLFPACHIGTLQHIASTRLLALPAAMRYLPAPLRLTQDDAILLASMITGDRTYLNRSLRAGFERTGSFHMLVVSGFHLAIVAACVFWLARRLRLPRVPATLATIAASFVYALFTGFATPVQRSLWMVTLYLLGRLIYRQRSPMNTIGFAALCLLSLSPRSLFDSSFQMTLLAVVSIAGIAAPLLANSIHPYLAATRNLGLVAIDPSFEPKVAQFRVMLRMVAETLQSAIAGPESRLAARISWRVFPWTLRFMIRTTELLVVSCVVELAMTLPMAIYFHRITLFALPVNLFILPLLIALMPAALLTLIAVLIWPPAASVPAVFAAIPLHFGFWLVRAFGSLTFGDLRVPAPLLGQSLTFIGLLAAAILLARSTRVSTRRAVWAAMILAAFAVIAPRPIDHPRNGLLMEAIDVGQGDSLLVITPDGKTLLIDGGGFGGGPRQAPQDFDIGEEVVSPALWARGIRRLDAVALSHAHSDHMGGLPAVLRNFHPAELWVGSNPRFAAYNALLSEAATLHIRIRSLRAGDSLTLGAAQVNVLAPFPDYEPGPEPSNNDSLVLRVAYGETSVLLEGDAEAPIEQAMLAEPDLASTLLKVGHHGSITSTRPQFLARVAPQWAVISCGLRNRYGHPRSEVLEELQMAHVRTFRTDLNGASCFLLDGKSLTADPLCASSAH
jgi:competence protein ComEC